MTERTYTEKEVEAIAMRAAQLALAQRPVPTHCSLVEAADILGLSVRTVAKLKLERNEAGKIPYEVVVAARSRK